MTRNAFSSGVYFGERVILTVFREYTIKPALPSMSCLICHAANASP